MVKISAEHSVKIRYQKTTSEVWEDFMCSVVTAIFGVYNSVRLLQLPVVTVRKWSINPITNPNIFYSHYHVRVFSAAVGNMHLLLKVTVLPIASILKRIVWSGTIILLNYVVWDLQFMCLCHYVKEKIRYTRISLLCMVICRFSDACAVAFFQGKVTKIRIKLPYVFIFKYKLLMFLFFTKVCYSWLLPIGRWKYSCTVLDIGSRWAWVVSFTPQPLYSRGKKPQLPIVHRRMGGSQNRSGRVYAEEKYLLSYWESNLVSSIARPVD
jgi:hypothetical protein